MTERVRGRGEKPTVTPKSYRAWTPDGERKPGTVRLNARNKERYEKMGWRFEAVYG